jgi:hypothetical protein
MNTAGFLRITEGRRVLIMDGNGKKKQGCYFSIEMTSDLKQVFDNLPSISGVVESLLNTVERGELEKTLNKMDRLKKDVSKLKSIAVTSKELETIKMIASWDFVDAYDPFVRRVKPLFNCSTEKKEVLVELLWQFHRLSYHAWSWTWDVRGDAKVDGMFDLINSDLNSALSSLLPPLKVELEVVA